MMNLLMISLHADPTVPAGIGEGGGTHSYIRELLTFLANKDIQVFLITRKCHPDLEEHEAITAKCFIHRIILNGENSIDKKMLYTLHEITFGKIQRVLQEFSFKPDLIHSIYWNSGQVANELSRKLAVPFVHSVISNGLRRVQVGMRETIEERFSIEKLIFDNAFYIVCITPSEKEDLVYLYNISPEKIIVSGRPVSKEFLYPVHDDFGVPYLYKIDKTLIDSKTTNKLNCNLPELSSMSNNWWGKNAFIYCGRIAPNKGVDIIIRAWISLKRYFKAECPPLWIVGGTLTEIEDFKAKQNLCKILEDYEKENELIWWGYLDYRGISTLFLKAHALLMHSSYEPGGRVIIEALSAGIPVIATPNGFGADYVHNWFNGFLVNYGDIDTLCNIMSLFIKQPYLSNFLGIHAKRHIKTVLDDWDFSMLHLKMYESTFARKKSIVLSNQNKIPINLQKNYINIYPFFNDIIQESEINTLLVEKQDQTLNVRKLDTDFDSSLWLVEDSNLLYEIQQPYTKLCENVYYNVCLHTLVERRSDIYEREKYASSLNGINSILYSIDNHYIFIKKYLDKINYSDLKDVNVQKKIADLLILFSKNEYIEKGSLKSVKWEQCNVNMLKNISEKYFGNFPTFFCKIYPFSLGYSVRQLYYIVHSQKNHLPQEFIDLYSQCTNFLYQIDNGNMPIYGFCLDDCSIENIGFDKKNLKYMFRHASSLYFGDINRMYAKFLYGYFMYLLKNNDAFCIEYIVNSYLSFDSNCLCVGWLIEISLEYMILNWSTMQENAYKRSHLLLKKLMQEYLQK